MPSPFGSLGRNRFARCYAAGGALAIVIAMHGAAQAQLSQTSYSTPLFNQFLNPYVSGATIEPDVTVASRSRPELEPQGVPAGPFIIRPELAETTGFDDNVTGTRRARGSVLAETRAAMQASFDQADAGVVARLTVDDFRYFDQPQQSYTNWTASVGGTRVFGRDRLTVGYTHQNLVQNARDLDVPQLDQPIAFRTDGAQLSYRTEFGQAYMQPSVGIQNYDFDNGTVLGQPYRQSYRNRVAVSPTLAAGYEIAPRRKAVVVLQETNASYTGKLVGLPVRDFNDFSALGGIDFDITGVVRLRLLGGYEVRTFTSAQYKTIDSPIVETSLTWTPTGLTTVTGSASRRIQDSASEATVGSTETAMKLTVDHEFSRDILLQGYTGYALDEYGRGQGSQAQYTAGASATWLLNRNLQLAASYGFADRTPNSTGNNVQRVLSQGQLFGSGYTENQYLLQLKFNL